MFQQRKLVSIWARRKTHISTPVVTTTDAGQQEGKQKRSPSLSWSPTWICWMGVTYVRSGSGTKSLKKKSNSTVYTLLNVYFFCAIKNWGVRDFMEEDMLRLQLLLGGEELKNQHSHFSPSYVPCFIPTSAVHFSIALWAGPHHGRKPIPNAVVLNNRNMSCGEKTTCSGDEVKTVLTKQKDPTEPALAEKTWCCWLL